MSLKLSEIISGVCVILLASWFIFEATQLPPAVTKGDVGPAAFPIGIAIATIVFTAIMIIKAVLTKVKIPVSIERKKYILGISIAFLLYAFLMPIIGYYFTTGIIMPIMLFIGNVKKVWKIIVVTVVFVLFAFAVFDIILQVPLP